MDLTDLRVIVSELLHPYLLLLPAPGCFQAEMEGREESERRG